MKIKRVETIEINGFNWIKEDILLKGNPHMLYEEALFLAERLNARIPDKEDIASFDKLPRKYDDGLLYIAEKKEFLSDPNRCLIFNATQGYRQQGKFVTSSTHGFYWLKEKDKEHCHYIMLADEDFFCDSAVSTNMKYELSLKLIKL